MTPEFTALAAYGEWLRRSLWAYPALETVHIASIATLFGSLLVLELRLFGLGAGLAIKALAQLALPVSVLGLAGAATSGLLLFAADADDLLLNPAFRLKMLLLVLAGINAAAFHAAGLLHSAGIATRVQAGLSILIWLAIMACGRMIAYV